MSYVEFFDPFPHEPLRPRLAELFNGAQRVQAAIAFVTAKGGMSLRGYLVSHPGVTHRLAISIQFPTNLRFLESLAALPSVNLRVHLGYVQPFEEPGERAQLHSKLMVIEYEDTRRCIVCGSHNWTGMALDGNNLEAGMIIHCVESEPLVAQVRRHIDGCWDRSEDFRSERMRAYETIQRKLHVGPDAPDSQVLPGFCSDAALVIHAEDAGGSAVGSQLRVYVPIQRANQRRFFVDTPDERRVYLLLYPNGSLHGQKKFPGYAALYEGNAKMDNDVVGDRPVYGRDANSKIVNLREPMLEYLAGNVPVGDSPARQEILVLDRKGEVRLPVYHCDAASPRMRLDLEPHAVARDPEQEAPFQCRLSPRDEEVHQASWRIPEPPAYPYIGPGTLIAKTVVRVPSAGRYPFDVREAMERIAKASGFLGQDAKLNLDIGRPAPRDMISPFVYLVTHRWDEAQFKQETEQGMLFPQL